MADTPELKKIKKIYGEEFSRLCRDMFPVILEQEGKLLSILENKFSHNCNSLYESITENNLESDFKNLIYDEFGQKIEEKEKIEERTPYEILDEAGYTLYECKTEGDIQSFRKYYAPNEVLCTIYGGGRLATRDCFFAVSKDIDNIKRENFSNPQKTDKYSTSVLGIQFTRDARSTVQIISRYNHTVNNPNCTLGNDLDRLASGLSQSFTNLLKERGLNFNSQQSEKNFEIPGYTLAGDGKYYKYNMEVNGVYYCPDNIVISGGEARNVMAPEKGIVADYFSIDFENKTIKLLDKTLKDSFVDDLKEIEKIETEKTENKGKTIKVYQKDKEEPVIIGLDRDNQIVKYENQYIQEVGDNFLSWNKKISKVNMPKLERAENDFLYDNAELTEIDFPKLKMVGSGFLSNNTKISKVNIPKLGKTGYCFLKNNEELTEIDFPELKMVGSGFLSHNRKISKANLPKLERTGKDFLCSNEELTEIDFPELRVAGEYFLSNNTKISKVNMPKLEQVGDYFLYSNDELIEVDFPELEVVDKRFLRNNRKISKVNMPKLEQAEEDFLLKNEELTEVDFPELTWVGDAFLGYNTKISKVSMPKLEQTGDDFLHSNEELTEVDFPELIEVGGSFLGNNRKISKANMPKLEQVGYDFLHSNEELTEVDFPELIEVVKDFLSNNKKIKKVNMPKFQSVIDDLGRDIEIDSLENPKLKKFLKSRNVSEAITPSDIAVLDKKSEVTTSEVKNAEEIIQRTVDYAKNGDKKLTPKNDVDI